MYIKVSCAKFVSVNVIFVLNVIIVANTVFFFTLRAAAYIDPMKAWYDIKTRQEIVNKTLFSKIQVNG